MNIPQSRWNCPRCKASGWWAPSTHIGPRPTDEHDRPRGGRCLSRKLTPAAHPALPAMEAAFKAHPPARFPTDFTTHDRGTMATLDHARPFLWCLYDGGTHLCHLRGKTRADEREVLEIFQTLEGFKGRLYVYDGAYLREVSPEAAREFIAGVYEARQNEGRAE